VAPPTTTNRSSLLPSETQVQPAQHPRIPPRPTQATQEKSRSPKETNLPAYPPRNIPLPPIGHRTISSAAPGDLSYPSISSELDLRVAQNIFENFSQSDQPVIDIDP